LNSRKTTKPPFLVFNSGKATKPPFLVLAVQHITRDVVGIETSITRPAKRVREVAENRRRLRFLIEGCGK
jgi:hypothetical protein